MTSAQTRLRQAKNAKKKMAAVTGTSTSVPSGIPSEQPSPTPSVEVLHEKRGRGEDFGDATSQKNQRIDTTGS
ncbi:hypothetical protein A2U01_0041482, partial [Trifolium medium]|nr:hypothetical protein [Trifolium medium]